jgi:hypothetical protein
VNIISAAVCCWEASCINFRETENTETSGKATFGWAIYWSVLILLASNLAHKLTRWVEKYCSRCCHSALCSSALCMSAIVQQWPMDGHLLPQVTGRGHHSTNEYISKHHHQQQSTYYYFLMDSPSKTYLIYYVFFNSTLHKT